MSKRRVLPILYFFRLKMKYGQERPALPTFLQKNTTSISFGLFFVKSHIFRSKLHLRRKAVLEVVKVRD